MQKRAISTICAFSMLICLLLSTSTGMSAEAGVIYAGGTTIGEHTCKSIQITVIVERAKWEDEEWEVVETWHKENTDADLVSTSKKLEVEGGWYYRVFCIHSADGDMSDSFTDGLYVEEP